MAALPRLSQSAKQNHLDIAPPGGAHRAEDAPCNATREKLSVGGHPVYGAYFEGGMGYRIDKGNGIASRGPRISLHVLSFTSLKVKVAPRIHFIPDSL
jgi:hypothetical protein